MAAKQTVTRVVVTKTKTKTKKTNPGKKGNQKRCPSCGRYM